MMYTRCNNKFTKLVAGQNVPTYQYLFEYRGQYSIVNLQGEQVDMGVVHGDELQYIFSDIWGEDLTMSPADIKFSKNVFTYLLSNFAKTGWVLLKCFDVFYILPTVVFKKLIFFLWIKPNLEKTI